MAGKSRSPSVLTGQTVASPQAVLMQVNKYVHPCERLPAYIRQEDLALFAADYDKKENNRIRDYLVAFDLALTQSLCGAQDGSFSRLKRYQEQYLPDEGCDQDLEQQLSYLMFIDDLKEIRALVSLFLNETLSGQLAAEKKFATEREFFGEQIERAQKEVVGLKARIESLTKDLRYETDYNLRLFADEQVSQMCERAYLTFNLAKRGNQIRVLEKAVEERDAASTVAERNGASRLLTM